MVVIVNVIKDLVQLQHSYVLRHQQQHVEFVVFPQLNIKRDIRE